MKKLLMILVALVMVLALPFGAMAEVADPIPNLGIDLTPIFQALIALLASLVTIKLIPWIQARTTAQQQAALLGITKTLVFAAEQIYGSATGKEKLMYVKSQLAKKGYIIDLDAIEAMFLALKIEQNKPHTEEGK